ncbi:AraC family transcriptional regulator [Campylobacter sp. 9BO]|uniref:AraC family transcriptional regulator n=1 Tax=Campylobacter sp. 9BO TaxID=3424759 RepID=UPI003D33DA41
MLTRYGLSGLINSDIKNLNFYISDKAHSMISTIHEPSICIILQGAKSVCFDGQMFEYNENTYLLTSTHIPLNVSLTRASSTVPYVSLSLKFSLEEVYEVLKNIDLDDKALQKNQKGLFLSELSDELLEPVLRLILLLKKPQNSIKFIAELIKKEILYLLVTCEKSGAFLRDFAYKGSSANKISQAVGLIKQNFSDKLNIKELAKNCDMSESSFYQHFKTITSLSPLAFQKKIRLEEARNLLCMQKGSVSQVAYDVGYESASQFSREYSRMFGVSPKQDCKILSSVIA